MNELMSRAEVARKIEGLNQWEDALNREYEKGFARGVWHGVIVACGGIALLAFWIGTIAPGAW